MKLNILILAAVTIFGAAAQDAKTKASANVDFPFEVNGKMLPAGHYVVVPNNTAAMLQIREESSRKGFFLAGAGSGASGKTLLHFGRFGDRFVLRTVTSRGAVLTVPQSRWAAEIAHSVAGETVTVAVGE